MKHATKIYIAEVHRSTEIVNIIFLEKLKILGAMEENPRAANCVLIVIIHHPERAFGEK